MLFSVSEIESNPVPMENTPVSSQTAVYTQIGQMQINIIAWFFHPSLMKTRDSSNIRHPMLWVVDMSAVSLYKYRVTRANSH